MARVVLFLLIWAEAAFAQAHSVGPRAAAMGRASAGVSGDVFAGANPASWAEIPSGVVALAATQLFGLPELRRAEVIVAAPAAGGTAALGASTFGFDAYRETIISAGYARSIRAGTIRPYHLGARIHWYMVAIEGYGAASVPSLSAGVIFPVLPSFAIGFAASNLYVLPRPLASELERSICIGAAIRASPTLLIAADASKAASSPMDIRVGIETIPVAAIALRAGYTTDPSRLSAGIGLRAPPFFADVALERHETLGLSPSFSIGVQW